MTEQELEITKLVISVATPLVILVLGILINNTLEKNKSIFLKEHDWQNWWAKQFLEISHNYNTAVSKCVANIWAVAQIREEKLPGWEEEFKQKQIAIRDNIRLLQYLDWEIQNYIQFAPSSGVHMKEKQKELHSMLANLIETKRADFEQIRLIQFEFNESVRLAHAEILDITPNKSLHPDDHDARAR